MDASDRAKILKLVEDGKISPEEGMELLDMFDLKEDTATVVPPEERSDNPARWMRIRVIEMDTQKVKVNVRMPLGWMDAGLKMGAYFSPDLKDLDLNSIANSVSSGHIGEIMDVYDEEENKRVQIFLE